MESSGVARWPCEEEDEDSARTARCALVLVPRASSSEFLNVPLKTRKMLTKALQPPVLRRSLVLLWFHLSGAPRHARDNRHSGLCRRREVSWGRGAGAPNKGPRMTGRVSGATNLTSGGFHVTSRCLTCPFSPSLPPPLRLVPCEGALSRAGRGGGGTLWACSVVDQGEQAGETLVGSGQEVCSAVP